MVYGYSRSDSQRMKRHLIHDPLNEDKLFPCGVYLVTWHSSERNLSIYAYTNGELYINFDHGLLNLFWNIGIPQDNLCIVESVWSPFNQLPKSFNRKYRESHWFEVPRIFRALVTCGKLGFPKVFLVFGRKSLVTSRAKKARVSEEK